MRRPPQKEDRINATVYVSADGRCSLERDQGTVEMRTAFLGKGFSVQRGTVIGPDGKPHTLTFSDGQVRRVAPDGSTVDLHVSSIERL